MSIHKITLGSNPNHKKKAVFVMAYTETNIWRNYQETAQQNRDTIVPLVLMSQRWDGTIGFIGGEVDDGEDLFAAAVREFVEESGYTLSTKQINEFQFICSHETDSLVTHLLALKVSEDVLRKILVNYHRAEHFLAEGTLFTVQMINYPMKNSFDNFMKNNFALTVKEQILEAINQLGWIKKYNLT